MKLYRSLLVPAALLGCAVLARLSAEPAAPVPAPATCPVSGEELGSMGKPYVHIHQEPGQPDREIRFCCKGCLPTFLADPAKYLAKLNTSEACCEAGAAEDCCKVEGPTAETKSEHAH